MLARRLSVKRRPDNSAKKILGTQKSPNTPRTQRRCRRKFNRLNDVIKQFTTGAGNGVASRPAA
jgi:hypothetical protein